MSEQTEQKFKLVDLTVDNFVDRAFNSCELSVCHRCNKIITGSVYENNACVHLTCYACCYLKDSLMDGVEMIGSCAQCNITCRWSLSYNLTHRMNSSFLRCPIKSCGETFRLDGLKDHNLTHIKASPPTIDPIDVLIMIIKILALVSIVALIVSIPRAPFGVPKGALAFSSAQIISFDVPEDVVLNRLPYADYWCTESFVLTAIFCTLVYYLELFRYKDPALRDIDKKITTCCEE